MKTREGFVSNSSSSSFIIIGDLVELDSLENRLEHGVLNVGHGQPGETEFGWGPDTVRGLDSRLNLAFILARDYREGGAQQDALMKIDRAIQRRHPEYLYTVQDWEGEWSYADHQSAVDIADELFGDDEEPLFRFLFSKRSYIELDNDNH
jgi:hypothetical protein